LVARVLGDNEPLVGDLIEECERRSPAWLWRQLAFAAAVRLITGVARSLREPGRLEKSLTSLAVFGILCFQVSVAGSLLDVLLRLREHERLAWLIPVALMAFPEGCAIGKLAGRVRPAHRMMTIVLCGGSAAVAAALVSSMLRSTGAVFFPSIGFQVGIAAVFLLGMRIGAIGGTATKDEAFSNPYFRTRT